MEWIKKKIGPGVHNITTVEEAEQILTSQDKIVVGYLDSLVASFQLLIIYFESCYYIIVCYFGYSMCDTLAII